jgi:hypothetical protein
MGKGGGGGVVESEAWKSAGLQATPIWGSVENRVQLLRAAGAASSPSSGVIMFRVIIPVVVRVIIRVIIRLIIRLIIRVSMASPMPFTSGRHQWIAPAPCHQWINLPAYPPHTSAVPTPSLLSIAPLCTTTSSTSPAIYAG